MRLFMAGPVIFWPWDIGMSAIEIPLPLPCGG